MSSDESDRGAHVSSEDNLLRVIVQRRWWNPETKQLSSAIFGFRKFSAFLSSMDNGQSLLTDFTSGSGVVEFNCGVARELGFDARHEPENGNDAHAHVYCELASGKRKKQARKLVHASVIKVEPSFSPDLTE